MALWSDTKRDELQKQRHFRRNQIEDYKSSQKRNHSTRQGNSPVFLFFFFFKDDCFGFVCFYTVLSCYTTKELIPLPSRPQFAVFRILLGSAFTADGLFPSAPPFNTCDYLKLQNSELDRASRSLRDQRAWLGGTDHTDAKQTGLLWFSKTGRMKLGMKYPHVRYHKYQSKKPQTLS